MTSPNEKMPISARITEQAPSPVAGQNDSSSIAKNGRDNDLFKLAESLVLSSKKLEDNLKLIGKKILHHEENIEYLNKIRGNLDHKIKDMQVALSTQESSSKEMTTSQVVSHKMAMADTIERIMQHEKSAASVLCHLTRHITKASPARDVVGVLATLGHVDNINLSRVLSEYLGLGTMLALVCKSYQGVRFMETYDKEGSINERTGLHWLGACNGKIKEGRYDVICLENIKPFAGEFMLDDPQKRLVLLEPKLANGQSPAGFLGFAVNMIYIDSENLSLVTDKGYGIRETLFYHLLARVQVYRTRTDMLQAQPCISHGAISLDGGIIKRPGVFILGTATREDKYVRFGIWTGVAFPSKGYIETKKEMGELEWQSHIIKEDIQKEEALLADEKSNFEVKRKEFLELMAQMMLIDPMQQPVQETQEGDSDAVQDPIINKPSASSPSDVKNDRPKRESKKPARFRDFTEIVACGED